MNLDSEPKSEFALTLRTDTDVRRLRMARRMLAAMIATSGASRHSAFELEVAVGEALANAHRHAYGGQSGPLQIEISAQRVVESKLVWTISVHDHGTAVTPPVLPESSPRHPAGRGLFMIRRLVDQVTIVVNPDTGKGISITLVKTVAIG